MKNYFLASDLLGFSNIVSNLDQDALNERIKDWIRLVQGIKSKFHIKDLQFLSDTIFVREEDSREGLQRLLEFSRSLLEKSIEQSFPVRGAITYGDITWGSLIYGKPVIEAHRLELSQDWIGIACSPGLPRIDSFWDWECVAVYSVPKKSGKIHLMPALVWNIPGADEMSSKTTSKGLYGVGDHLLWEWQSKLIQTIIFSKYLQHGRSKGLDPKYFSYQSPLHFLDLLN